MRQLNFTVEGQQRSPACAGPDFLNAIGLTVIDTNLVLSGALRATALAMLMDALLGAVGLVAIPCGLRLKQD